MIDVSLLLATLDTGLKFSSPISFRLSFKHLEGDPNVDLAARFAREVSPIVLFRCVEGEAAGRSFPVSASLE